VWVFGRLKPFWWPYRRTLYLSIITMGCLTAIGLVRPFLLQQLIDRVITGGRYGLLLPLSLSVIAVAVARGVFNYLRQYCGELFGQKVIYDVRNALYQHLQYVSFKYYDRQSTGDLMSRLTGDVDAFRTFLTEGVTDLSDFFFSYGFGLVAMLTINARLTLVTLVLSPCIAVTVRRFDRLVRPAYSRIREAYSDLSTVVQENLTGIRTVKSFAREPHELEKFGARNDAYARTNVAAQDLQGTYWPLMQLISNLGTVLLLWYGGRMVIAGQLSLGDLVAFFSLVGYLIWPVQELGFLINLMEQASAGGERLIEILEAPRDIADRPRAVAAERIRGHVRFEGVEFAYEHGHPVLQGIDLDAPAGSVIALLGTTGAGKSSLVGLIPRFYDVTAGRVTIDGRDVRDYSLPSLRRAIGVVLGETFLFSASLRENIAFGRMDATDEDIERASRIAQAHAFIAELPDGYDTIVGERGLGLSGGQKQRVALARALVCDPRILILDDATSSVDMETEYEIQQALRQVMAGRTTFVIAHRISSLRRADEILVLDRGRIVERGTHEQLLRTDGLYRAIYEVQFRDRDAVDPGRRRHLNGALLPHHGPDGGGSGWSEGCRPRERPAEGGSA
jgi:ATP-binding cassette subfamily B multidrug efflux pump